MCILATNIGQTLVGERKEKAPYTEFILLPVTGVFMCVCFVCLLSLPKVLLAEVAGGAVR